MNRRPSRKEDRKNERMAKKQRNAMHHQKMVGIRKESSLPQTIASKTPAVAPKQSSKPSKPSKTASKGSFKKPRDYEDGDDDEEIFSDSDAYSEDSDSEIVVKVKEPKSKTTKTKTKTKKAKKRAKHVSSEEESMESMGDEDDFLALMDKAFESGKLTKDGFVKDDGKIDTGKFVGNDQDEDEEEDLDLDLELESEESEEEIPEIPEPVEPRKSQSMLRKAPAPSASAAATSETASSSSENVKLVRQIQSLVNKLGSSNLVPICNEFEVIFRNNRRKEVIEILTDTIIGSIVRPGGNLLDSFALNFAALSFIINHMVGIEFGAHLIEKLIETIDSLYIESKSTNGIEQKSNDPNIHERSLVNCMNFCSFLYDLQLISSNLICDLIRQSAGRLDEIDVEIILKLFKTCGQQIKRDDADFMKVISSEISKNSHAHPNENQSSRFKFMIETINDLKDSKRKLANAMTVELEPIKKMLKNFLSQKLIAKIEPLRISLEDIRNIESKGKWWLVGSSWHPQTQTTATATETTMNTKNEELAKIEKLAKAQRMNTELRKSIFSTIISSDDYSDAFERLLAMKLTGKQEREIILVIIHCCGQEQVFNPFYGMLAGKFASYRQGFKVTLQYTLWDCLKQIKDYPLRKLANIAKLYGTLLGQEDLPLSVLRKGNFVRLCDEERIFWQLLFMTLFTKIPSDDELTNISQNLVNSIETGKSDNPSAASTGKSKIVSLTENVDMTEFDDEFFAAQDKIQNSRGMSADKLEECKNLRNGMIYFLDLYFLKTNDFPFTSGIEICKKRAKRMKQVLSD